MANNCLVKTLKGVVNNESLPKLGEVVITTTSDRLDFRGPSSARLIGTSGSLTQTQAGAWRSTTGSKVAYTIPYNVTDIELVSTGEVRQYIDLISILKYRTSVKNLYLTKIDISDTPLVDFDFSNMVRIYLINVFNQSGEDIANLLPVAPNLIELKLSQTYRILGELESILDAVADSDRTTSTNLTFQGNSKVTIGGTVIADGTTRQYTFSGGEWSPV